MTVTMRSASFAELDLKEVLAKIDQKLDHLSKEVGDIRQNDLALIKVGQARLEGKVDALEGKIDGLEKRLEDKIDGLEKRLEDKIDGLGKRLDNQEFISRGFLVGLFVAILGGFAKLFGLVGQ